MTISSMQPKKLQHARIGYVPTAVLLRTGDKRRFEQQQAATEFEIADPLKKYDLIVLNKMQI